MNASTDSPLPLAQYEKNNFSTEANENSFHVFSDREWMAVRHQQMDVAPNCIFPARERKSMANALHVIFLVLATAFKLPIRF
ncbi:MAG: hypothetical protein IPO83_00810 [Chitinophagaceae bacterium]|nr:hypothetical protein [Chitinophagaceae bacterium]